MLEKSSKLYLLKLLRDLLVKRPCKNEKGEGNCVRKEHKSNIMIIYVKILCILIVAESSHR